MIQFAFANLSFYLSVKVYFKSQYKHLISSSSFFGTLTFFFSSSSFPFVVLENTRQAHQEPIMLISQWFSGISSLYNCVWLSRCYLDLWNRLPCRLSPSRSVDRSCRPSHFSALCRPGRPAPLTMPSPSLIVISCLGLFRVSPVNHAERPGQTRGTSSVRGGNASWRVMWLWSCRMIL